MEKVKCIECSNFSLKNKQGGGSPMAIHGCGYCAFNDKPGEYLTALYLRECGNFKSAENDVIESRLNFLKEAKNGK